MKQVKLAVYVLAGLTVLSFFLTWFTASASITISSEFGGGGSDSSESVIGLFSGQGFFALLLLAAAVYMFHKEMKFSYLPIVINILNGLTVLYVTTGVKVSTSSIAGSATSGLYPGVGVYLFMLVSTLLLGVLLVKEFKPDLFEKGGAIDKMTPLDFISNEYVVGGAILGLGYWCSQNIAGFSSISGFLMGGLFFIAAPYYLAKLAKFGLVQILILSFSLVYGLILVFSFLNFSSFSSALYSVPAKVKAVVDKLDLKKMAGVWMVMVLLLFGTAYLTVASYESQYNSENEATEEVIEEEAPAPSQEEEVVQEEEEGSSYSEPSPEPAVEAAAATPQKPAVQLYSIKDPDGYTNLRATAGGKIIRKVYENETFELVEAGETYSKIKLKDGTTGFLHNSRIAVAN